jgi:hypothetical protein
MRHCLERDFLEFHDDAWQLDTSKLHCGANVGVTRDAENLHDTVRVTFRAIRLRAEQLIGLGEH